MIIHKLFPEPVYFSKLERALTKEELKIINKHKKKTYKNEGNTTSNNNYVLENKALKNLKKDLHKMVKEQQAIIDGQKEEINVLQAQMKEIKQTLIAMSSE